MTFFSFASVVNKAANKTPSTAPRHCAKMNMGTDLSAIPAKDSLRLRANVIAGFANDVDEVNMYAAPIQAGTITAAIEPLF